MIRRLAVMALVPGALVFGVAPAQADDKGYLSYLDAHGFKYQNHPGLTTPAGAVEFGQIICQNLRRGRPARDRFDKKIAEGITQVVVDAAQHEMCPETLGASATTAPGAPMTTVPPLPPLPPTPEAAPAPPAPELPPGQPAPEPPAPAAPEPFPAPPAPEPFPAPPAPEPFPAPPAPEPFPAPPAPEPPPVPAPPAPAPPGANPQP